MDTAAQEKEKKTFTDYMRFWFKGILDPIAAFLNRLGIAPNTMTIMGLLMNIGAAYLLSQGQMFWGGVLVLIGGPFDALDGTMARLRGEASDFGAFVDSVTDRYSELFILGGLSFYFTQQGDWLSVMGCYAAAVGSVMVSYTKARAVSLKFNADIGILTRVERYLVIAPLLLFNLPIFAIWIVAVLANVTALQRIWKVRRQARG
jgi:CDP-diacylglycerol---glycerol-3-phosphate 3-phosphatidyltransferase